ncbi:MAG TPA: metallophosphoesterase [Solirubrobacteraceae bacterium]|nr:metallophosphoesterase [Solirubrobacteraceae bacterium]
MRAIVLVSMLAAAAPGDAVAAPVLAAAGDVACEPGRPSTPVECQQGATAAEIERARPTVVAALGDSQYAEGTLGEFSGPGSFDQTWGAFKSRIRPALGNHEYGSSPTAAGYFEYFGAGAGPAGRGYYSYNLGAWHVIVLNSSCTDTECSDRDLDGSTTSRQLSWLRSDLAHHRARCVLAYWHHPLFSSVRMLNDETGIRPLWDVLLAAKADVVLNGHAHNYERFAAQNAAGAPRRTGLHEFVVGTGGRSHLAFDSKVHTSRFRDDKDFGVLFLTLHRSSYDWKFRTVNGKVVDRGSARCH